MNIVTTHGAQLGIAVVCAAIGMARASFYRWLHPMHGPLLPRISPRALSCGERASVLAVLHEDRFVDQPPAEVYSTLLDEGQYLCSERTMYRVLAANAEVRERRDQLRHPSYAAPELLATQPNQLWSWDITKLLGPDTWSYFYLYVILDVFSRYVVGWMVALSESAELAKTLFRETCARQRIVPGQLTLHADRGPSMRSKALALLLSDLGVLKTHSRPHVSNDNPYSESHFKTLKYRPGFPDRFGAVEDARSFCAPFFDWYNNDHHHGGLAMLTPSDVHHGRALARVEARTDVLSRAFDMHPERFVRGAGVAAPPPTAAWINKPALPADSKLSSASQHNHDEVLADRSPPPRGTRAVFAIAPEPAPAKTTHVVSLPDARSNGADARPQTPQRAVGHTAASVPPKCDSKRIASRLKRTHDSTELERH